MRAALIFTFGFTILAVYLTAVPASAVDEGNYILIYHPAYIEELTPLINWRNNHGHTVVAKTINWVYDHYSKPEPDESIKAFISDAYNNWSVNLEYVLLAGSNNQIPSHDYIYYSYYPEEDVCDTWYTLLDDDDIPDVAIGRLPVSSEDAVSAYVNKVIYYESHTGGQWKEDIYLATEDPTLGNNDLILNVIPDDYDVEIDSETEFGEDYEGLSYSCITNISEGKIIALHNGYSEYSYWSYYLNNGYYTVYDLENYYKYPIVLGMNCQTGDFSEPTCIGIDFIEAVKQVGEIEYEIGSIAYIGSAKAENPIKCIWLGRAFLEEILRSNAPSVGTAFTDAKGKLIIQKPSVTETCWAYHFLGDPALEVDLPFEYFPELLSRWPVYQGSPVGNSTVSAELPLAWEDPVQPPGSVVSNFSNDSPLCGSWAENATPVVIAPSGDFTKTYYSTTQEAFDLYSSGDMQTPVTADVDADGEMDTVIVSDFDSSCKIYLLGEDGMYKPGFPVSLNESCDYPPAIGDINADGYLDIIVATDTKLHAIDHEGNKQVLANFNDIYQGNVAAGSPAIGDINQDGYLEIIMSLHLYPQEYSYLVVYEQDGDIVQGWPVLLPTELITAPALADINGDPGDIEIVVGSVNNPSGGGPGNRMETREDWDNGQCRVFEYDGTYITSGPTTSTKYELPPVVADVMGDPTPEILLVNEQYGARVNVYDPDCTLIDDFSYGGTPTSPPTVADVDGDGLNEVIMGTEGELKNIYDPGLSTQWNCPLYGDVSAPAVCDLDDDGSTDIVCGDGEAVYAFTTEGSYDNGHLDEEWSKSGHDNMNTGLWDILAPTNVVAEDVPDDEGGAIEIRWAPSLDDGIRSTRAQGYQIWRREWMDITPPESINETGDDIMAGTVSPVTASRSVKTDIEGEYSDRNLVGWDWIDSTIGSSYIDDTVENHTEEYPIYYAYKLITGDAASLPPPPGEEGNTIIEGHLSQPSIGASAEAHDNIPPAPPTNLEGSLTYHSQEETYDVHLEWELSINDPQYGQGPINTEGRLSGTDTVASGTDTVAKITLPRSEWDTPRVTGSAAVTPPAPVDPELAKKMEGLKSSAETSGLTTTGISGGNTSEEYGDKLKEKAGSLAVKNGTFTITPSESASGLSPGDPMSGSTSVSPVTERGKTTYRDEQPEALDVESYWLRYDDGGPVIVNDYIGPPGTDECDILNIPENGIESYTFWVFCKDGENDSEMSNPYEPEITLGKLAGILTASDGSTLVVAGSDTGVSAYDEPTAYPNPFTESVTIGWPLDEEDSESPEADVVIYDIAGRKVKSFSNVSDCHVLWTGLDENGNAVPGGVYIVNVTVDGETFAYKVMRK